MRSRFLGRGSATKRSYSLTKGKLFRVKFALTKTVSKSTRHGKIKQYRSDGQNGICGVYPYLTRLQVAKFALAGGNFVGKTLFIGGTEL